MRLPTTQHKEHHQERTRPHKLEECQCEVQQCMIKSALCSSCALVFPRIWETSHLSHGSTPSPRKSATPPTPAVFTILQILILGQTCAQHENPHPPAVTVLAGARSDHTPGARMSHSVSSAHFLPTASGRHGWFRCPALPCRANAWRLRRPDVPVVLIWSLSERALAVETQKIKFSRRIGIVEWSP